MVYDRSSNALYSSIPSSPYRLDDIGLPWWCGKLLWFGSKQHRALFDSRSKDAGSMSNLLPSVRQSRSVIQKKFVVEGATLVQAVAPGKQPCG
jgi:hypothetical protein